MSEKFMRRFDERMQSPSIEEIDRTDPVAFYKARERWALERVVELEVVKIYRERVKECYRREEVNSRQYCRKIVNDYMKAFEAYKKKAFFHSEDGNWTKWKVDAPV
ncbi:hypothetical protein OS493_026685 [Desmophyllum pertusum]|uniref:NADH dehydrogenase [ubiquinone] 1 beta subcomplex subunit 10 n=1 Tax=Desmophyllum pertusum TaxID=174260 RepID=A0A9X0D946_9CNID|nr:hypothetical protein OS493_026685 [Desmophyllum pertusum]